MTGLLALHVEIAKANLYNSRMRELRETSARHGLQLNSRSRKREIVEALRANPSFRDARSKTARQLREARALIRDLDQEWGRSPNMLGALRGALSEAEREAPDEGTRRQMRAAEEMVGVHLFGDLDAWKAKEKLNAMRTTRDRRLLPKDHPARVQYDGAGPRKRVRKIAVIVKARRSLNAPKNKAQAERRLGLYERLLESGNGPVSRIGIAESQRLRDYLSTGKYGRGMTPGRNDEEPHRADSEYRRQTRLGPTGAKRDQQILDRQQTAERGRSGSPLRSGFSGPLDHGTLNIPLSRRYGKGGIDGAIDRYKAQQEKDNRANDRAQAARLRSRRQEAKSLAGQIPADRMAELSSKFGLPADQVRSILTDAAVRGDKGMEALRRELRKPRSP